MIQRAIGVVAAGSLLLCAACARAAGPAPLYELKARAEPSSPKAGAAGVVELAIETRPGAHLSPEAPLKVSLSGRNVRLEVRELGRDKAQQTPAGVRFQAPFVAQARGPASIDAELVFFVCTEKLCERQSRKIGLALEVQ